eukprot:7426197-Alexandrium_andersonii.AAC.1
MNTKCMRSQNIVSAAHPSMEQSAGFSPSMFARKSHMLTLDGRPKRKRGMPKRQAADVLNG